MQPGFMDDLARTAQERYAEMKQGVQAIPGNIAHAVSPVTERLSMLANEPERFASTTYDALKKAVGPAIGQAAAPAGVPTDPNARPGVPDEALPGDMAGQDEATRRQNIMQAIIARQQQMPR